MQAVADFILSGFVNLCQYILNTLGAIAVFCAKSGFYLNADYRDELELFSCIILRNLVAKSISLWEITIRPWRPVFKCLKRKRITMVVADKKKRKITCQ